MINYPLSPRGNSLTKFNFDLLSDIDRITEEDISQVREALRPVLVKVFDNISKNRQKIMAALYQRGYKDLAMAAGSDTYFTGVHNIGDELSFLLNGIAELTEKRSEKK